MVKTSQSLHNWCQYKITVAATLYKLTCRLSAQFPLPVAIETTEAVAVISAGVVYAAVQRKWN